MSTDRTRISIECKELENQICANLCNPWLINTAVEKPTPLLTYHEIDNDTLICIITIEHALHHTQLVVH